MLGVVLMAAQAFCYNAVFFTYALILTRFYGVAPGSVGLFILPFAAGNFLGPLVLGRLFDTHRAAADDHRNLRAVRHPDGDHRLAVRAWAGWTRCSRPSAWTVIFFVASAAASSAYLTVGESFPLEVRAIAIALFYAFGTGVGGVAGPALFGALIDTGSRDVDHVGLSAGRRADGGGGGGRPAVLAVTAERRPLEDVAPPLSAVA